jgi:DNA end-binding protein Ku
MPRAIWSGSISFGLVNIPVRLYSALSRKTVRFNQIDSATGARVRQKRVSAADGEEVPFERIVKGYELPSGDYVTLSDDEMAALDPEAVRTIDIDEFVDLADIDPIFYDNAYHLVPDERTAKPYKLLATAMEEAGKVGICHFVMRSKQYLAAVRPVDGRLLLSTMVYHDEVVDPAEIGGFDLLDDIEVDEKEQAMAEQLIATLDATFDPSRHHDTYREAVLELIERKAAGETGDDLVPAPAPSSDKVIDLMAALEASVKEAKKARGRHPASGRSTTRANAAKKAAKKATKRAKKAAKRAEKSA